MLEIKHLSKQFGDLQALNDVSFSVQSGQIMGLIGQNGAGKSTSFHSILNFLKYDGQISWNDAPITETVFNEIGYLPEERSLMPKLTVEQQIIYLARLKGKAAKEIRPKIDVWLDKFAVKGKRTDKIKDLSKGNQQKIQLICTLIHQPKLLILDEPFSGLDPVNVDLLEQAIFEAKKQGTAIIFSSHDMGNVETLCDQLIMLKAGRVVLSGRIEDVRSQFGKNHLFVTTNSWDYDRLIKLAHVTAVERLADHRYLLKLDDPAVGPDLFQQLTNGKYVEEFSQQAPTLDEIFKLKAGEPNA
ncbi:ABC transporter ATP-binding protein [Paucilactobacillus kaifaensis]|uniref:ABC transporter ATP-binding protein n=1 Tax=Paucilactobacillus kaifaensis TaxID=2559921 RepID=UPI0010F99E91|nr:ABC transporter ATP-binding protein [Paucilactobacillus kaifaensis]